MPAFFNTRSPVVRSPVDRKIPERPVRVRFDHEVIFWQKIIENIKCRKWRKKNSHNIKIFCEKIPCRSNLATKFKNQKIKKWLIEGRKNGFWVLTHKFKLISLSKTLLLMCNTLRPDRIRLRSGNPVFSRDWSGQSLSYIIRSVFIKKWLFYFCVNTLKPIFVFLGTI